MTYALIYILLFKLSMQWPRIIAQWNRIDAIMIPGGSSSSIDKIAGVIAAVFLISQTSKQKDPISHD